MGAFERKVFLFFTMRSGKRCYIAGAMKNNDYEELDCLAAVGGNGDSRNRSGNDGDGRLGGKSAGGRSGGGT